MIRPQEINIVRGNGLKAIVAAWLGIEALSLEPQGLTCRICRMWRQGRPEAVVADKITVVKRGLC